MTVIVSKPPISLREELASLRNQGGYQEQQFYFDGLVTNGTFDADTDWEITGSGLSITGGQLVFSGAGSTVYARQEILTVGKTYKVDFTVSGYSSGSVRLALGGTNGTARSANGTYTETLTATVNSLFYVITASAGTTLNVDNVSVFELDANGDVGHRMPKGWKPKDVYEKGLLQREGSAHDYEVVYDGFDYYVKPTVAPSATTQTCVIGVKA